MALEAGTKLGSYEILSPLGAGGMGEVYRAHDTKLGRQVALKILPNAFAQDADRLARFRQEAQVLASLNHPNIAQIHGLEDSGGTHALVMELVEGPTLADWLAKGPIPVDEALPIARQIGEALEAAHEQGIIHRDLKPANIKVRDDGTVKVLDFGLAKAMGPAAASGDPADSPTLTSPAMTQMGMVLGTAAYMSPEQARGRPVDKRSDIFSFGCVLYEMLTGAKPFAGETVSELIGAVLHQTVDFGRLPPGVPTGVRRALVRCLERDRAARYRDIGDAVLDLRSFPADGDTVGAPAGSAGRRTRWIAAGAFIAGAVVIGAVAWLLPWRPTPAPAAPKHFSISGLRMPVDAFLSIAIAPDGSRVASRGLDETGRSQIFVSSLESGGSRPVGGSGLAWGAFFSPDGSELAFHTSGEIKVASVTGGEARLLAKVPNGFTGGVWVDDSIVFAGESGAVLYRVAASGGNVETVKLDAPPDVDVVAVTSAVPGRDAILCSVRRPGRVDAGLIALGNRSLRILQENAGQPVYSASGHILLQPGSGGPVLALPFDADRLAPAGAAFPVIPGIASRVGFQTRLYDLAADGTFIFVPPKVTANTGTLVWVDQSGVTEDIVKLDHPIDLPRLSHDGTRVAFRLPAPSCDIWVHDLTRGTTMRLTREGDNHGIVWSADDERIATFRRSASNARAVWLRSDGAGSVVDASPTDLPFDTFVSGLAPGDDAIFIVGQGNAASHQVGILNVRDAGVKPLLSSRFNQMEPALSPDGRLLAYVSNESGRNEVYVQPFPALDARVQVSTEGGGEPVWSRDGRTLFFRNGNAMLRAAVAAGTRPAVSRAEVLFEGAYATGAGGVAAYDVSPDGRRFVMVLRQAAAQTHESMGVIVNFFTELQRLRSRAPARE